MANNMNQQVGVAETVGHSGERSLSKKDVLKVFWKWTFASHANYNYERMQASGVLFSMSDIPDRLYPGDQQAKIDFMKRHMQFYNTEPHFGGIVNGLALAMEEEKANNPSITGEAITAMKTGLMGPMAGVGDTLWQGTIQPILLAIGISLVGAGSSVGAIFYVAAMAAIMLSIAYFFFMTGYKSGKQGVERLLGGGQMKRLIAAASIMGAIVLGALAASYVTAASNFVIPVGGSSLALQADILDKLLKGLLPLLITLGTWYLLKVKKISSTKVMIILVIVGAVLGATGILGAAA